MYEVQKFAISNIYCAPSQDKQYRFKMVRVTREGSPVKRLFTVYNRTRNTPNNHNPFHIFTIGNLPANIFNLVSKDRSWVRDQWRSVETDMNERNFIMQLYDCTGLVFPRKNIYYSVGNNELLIAIEIDGIMNSHFNVETCAFMRVYSNEYFNSTSFNGSGHPGIFCDSRIVRSNVDKVTLQNQILTLEANGGKTLIYVNGYYVDRISLDIPNESVIEFVYDKSILSKETKSISDMRTFQSERDSRVKYLLYRDRTTEYIQYEDDLELYISGKLGEVTKGLYYYQHKQYALTNVTDKDFALDTNFVNNQATELVNRIGGSIGDKTVTVFARRSSVNRNLVYSSLKLHELYKLPHDKQRDILSNTGVTLEDFRVEYLEDSSYFKLASVNQLKDITKELSTDAVGYNGVSYYFGNTPSKIADSLDIEVPLLFRKPSTAYEYDADGLFTGHYPTIGPMYDVKSSGTKHVEFVQGRNIEETELYSVNEDIPVRNSEFRIISALFEAGKRLTIWSDVTDDPSTLYSNDTVKVSDTEGVKVKIIYFDEIVTRDLEIELSKGVMLFPLEIMEDSGNGYSLTRLDVPFDSISVFLNKRRLTYKVDYLIDYPNVMICNKHYIDYTKEKQNIHVRLQGYNIVKDKINNREITGFVSHGVLTRNNYYDIRDDKVFSTFIDGKLKSRTSIKFSENDNTVRINHPLNGVPYTISEPKLSIKEVTGLPTLPYFYKNEETNKRISELFNSTFPEPPVGPFNVIGDHHYLYSPLVAKVIQDLLSGAIASSIYTNPYNDTTIQNLITGKYSTYYNLDPIRLELPSNIVEIHPHFGNTVVEVNLFQFRFLTNLVRIITGGNPSRINLSGYIAVNTNIGVEVATEKSIPGGVVVL